MKFLVILCVTTVPTGLLPSASHPQVVTATYGKTRELLIKMERRAGNRQLKTLFEQADIRMPDLINALSDPEKQISINAQVIIKYLADPAGLRALDDWYKAQNKMGREFSMPKIAMLG